MASSTTPSCSPAQARRRRDAPQLSEIRDRFFPFCCGINGSDRYAADHIWQLLDRLTPETAAKVCKENFLGLIKRY